MQLYKYGLGQSGAGYITHHGNKEFITESHPILYILLSGDNGIIITYIT